MYCHRSWQRLFFEPVSFLSALLFLGCAPIYFTCAAAQSAQSDEDIVPMLGVMKRAVQWTSTDVDMSTDVDERQPSTGWKSAVWSASTKKSAVASTSTVDGQQLYSAGWSTSTSRKVQDGRHRPVEKGSSRRRRCLFLCRHQAALFIKPPMLPPLENIFVLCCGHSV